VRAEREVGFPDAYCFVIASSGVLAEKTGAALALYNRAAQRVQAAMELWRSETGRRDAHFAEALGSAPDAERRMRAILQTRRHARFAIAELVDRFEQFVAESEQIVPAVPDELTADTLQQFGELVDRSQQLAATKLGNQVPETVFLAESARKLGAVAASAFGAGFGGSVWAMVPGDSAQSFATDWSKRYVEAFPQHAAAAKFVATRPGPAASIM
jgi:galactokinase